MLKKVISGGQTGVDVAALRAAKASDLETGGYMPRGFKTDEGNRPKYEKDFGMKATSSPDYPDRTRMNIRSADATLQIASNFKSRGEKLTTGIIQELKKETLQVVVNLDEEPSEAEAKTIADWIREKNIQTLNVAGNSESTSPGIHDWAFKLLSICFRILKEENRIIA